MLDKDWKDPKRGERKSLPDWNIDHTKELSEAMLSSCLAPHTTPPWSFPLLLLLLLVPYTHVLHSPVIVLSYFHQLTLRKPIFQIFTITQLLLPYNKTKMRRKEEWILGMKAEYLLSIHWWKPFYFHCSCTIGIALKERINLSLVVQPSEKMNHLSGLTFSPVM